MVGGGVTNAFGLSDDPDCHVYLIDGGDELALIDCGMAYGDSLERILGNVRAEGLDPARITKVIVTHYHMDHAGGAARFSRAPRGRGGRARRRRARAAHRRRAGRCARRGQGGRVLRRGLPLRAGRGRSRGAGGRSHPGRQPRAGGLRDAGALRRPRLATCSAAGSDATSSRGTRSSAAAAWCCKTSTTARSRSRPQASPSWPSSSSTRCSRATPRSASTAAAPRRDGS